MSNRTTRAQVETLIEGINKAQGVKLKMYGWGEGRKKYQLQFEDDPTFGNKELGIALSLDMAYRMLKMFMEGFISGHQVGHKAGFADGIKAAQDARAISERAALIDG